MTQAERDALLDRFVAKLKVDSFDDYRVVSIGQNYDSDWHMADWDGRFLVLSGKVELEIGGNKRSYSTGGSYDVAANTRHREVFSAEGGSLVIARRSVGTPLPALRASPAGVVSLR